MIREQFIGRNPSHFQVNPLVKSFIISEAFIWSALNFFVPIFAVFVTTKIAGGNIQLAASAYSVHLISRVVMELIICKKLTKTRDIDKLKITIAGLFLLSLSYIGFALTPLFAFYSLTGIGLGIASPAKNSLFSTHLDKNKEPTEWGIYDAVVFFGMALATALGGFIASAYGFELLFILASVLNLIGILPYVLYFVE